MLRSKAHWDRCLKSYSWRLPGRFYHDNVPCVVMLAIASGIPVYHDPIRVNAPATEDRQK
jgi:hypothetical protein